MHRDHRLCVGAFYFQIQQRLPRTDGGKGGGVTVANRRIVLKLVGLVLGIGSALEFCHHTRVYIVLGFCADYVVVDAGDEDIR